MKDTRSPFVAGGIYHIYNHGNAYDDLFLSNDNYHYFLTRCRKYISPFADILAYCLLPNHFHLLIRIRELSDFIPDKKDFFASEEELNLWVAKQFSNCFCSYAKAFNKQQGRNGSLFMKSVKRIRVDDEPYLRQMVLYINTNPVHHGFCAEPSGWKHSSYLPILRTAEFDPIASEMIRLFEDKRNFVLMHETAAQIHRAKILV